MAKKAARKKVARKKTAASRRVPNAPSGWGYSFIASVLAEGNAARLSDVSRDWFLEEGERPLYDWVREFHAEHRQLPSLGTAVAEGYRLAAAEGPSAHHMDKLRKRHLFNVINLAHPDFRRAMDAADPDAAMAVLREVTAAGASLGRHDAFSLLGSEVGRVMDDFALARQNIGSLHGVTYGRAVLDRETLGSARGQMDIIVGRTGVGKSWELLYQARAAWAAGHSVGIVTMEMDKGALVRRWVGMHSGINPKRIRSAEVSEFGIVNLEAAATELRMPDRPPVVMLSGDFNKDTGGIARMFERYMPDIVFVDAMYLMSPEGRQRGGISRWEAISEVVGQVKSMALRYERPIRCTVQFNRNRKEKSQSDPDTGDIAGSDSIPQDADLVLGGMLGVPPFEKTRRRWVVMKYREGSRCDYVTNFTFEPVDLSDVPPEDESSAPNTDWML